MDCCSAEGETSKGYCKKCKGMMWSLLGILLILNSFIWPKWDGIAFLGLILMLAGVWRAYVTGCSCHEKECCDKKAEKSVSNAPVVAETQSVASLDAPIAKLAHKKVVKAKKKK